MKKRDEEGGRRKRRKEEVRRGGKAQRSCPHSSFPLHSSPNHGFNDFFLTPCTANHSNDNLSPVACDEKILASTI